MTLSGNRMSVELQLQPRPPVPGSESPPDAFQEGNLLGNIKGGQGLQRHLDDPCKILQPLVQPVPLKSAMAPSPKATSESGSLRGFEPEGSADVTPPFRLGNKQSKAGKPTALINWQAKFGKSCLIELMNVFFSESSNSAHSSPAYLRWAENLHNLLSDPVGFTCNKRNHRSCLFLGWSWIVQELPKDWKCGGTSRLLVIT